ncbi:MAG TPA: tetratricopeptide repeat protein [Hyphomicrobiaceae bacterium]
MSLMPRVGRPDYFRGATGTLIVGVAVFVLIAGIGAAVSFWTPAATSRGTAVSSSHARSGSDGDLARLESYTRSIATEKPASAAAGELLPDVNTMIDRLAARLKAAPEDGKGWRMLGWSYFNTGRYEEAAAAYAKAVELDPTSADVKRLHEEAKAKASGSGPSETTSASQAVATAANSDDPHGGQHAKSEAAPSLQRDPAIRSMVDGLAARLERDPRDAEGWARLMRSRIVLGETDVAVTAYRKALDVFKGDADATGKITAAANELGLKAE